MPRFTRARARHVPCYCEVGGDAVTSDPQNTPNPNAGALQPSATTEIERLTGERDVSSDLISVIYHALQGAESCARYAQDALARQDEQLAQFFEEVHGSHVEIAQEAKQLLIASLDLTESDGA